LPVGASPLSFGAMNGSSGYSNGSYPSLTFNLNNPGTGIDGLQTYYFAVTVTNGLGTATKYFPVQFDLSQSQTFCPNAEVRRGAHANAAQVIRGAWGRNSVTAKSSTGLRSSKLPDVRIAATDISFTPSMPKTGDTVSVRFKISNVGDVDASGVPVALQVNGDIVAQDTFDVAAGKSTLGAVQWNNAKFVSTAGTSASPASAATTGGRAARMSRSSLATSTAASASGSPLVGMNAMIVIDPRHTVQQKTAVAKSAPLAHFSVHDSTGTASSSTPMTRQRAVLELADGACGGLRFNSGAGGCSGSADVTITVEDLGKGTYKLEAANGIADVGMGGLAASSNANFSMTVMGQNGHTYAVQLRGGQVGLLTMKVRNPNQLSEAAQRVFRGGPAAKVVSKLGASTAAPQPQAATESKVYFDIMYQGQ
jgi:hypothetical protein